MKYIQTAIKIVDDPESNPALVELELSSLRWYYEQNKNAHREYLEKGIYDLIPGLQEFNCEMGSIERIFRAMNISI